MWIPGRRQRREDELERERRAHLELEAEERGGDRQAARRALGNTTWIQEETRDMWGWTWLSTLRQDVRYGIRLARRTPVFSAFAVASLALGIGATSAIFSLYDALVLRTLPVPQADRLVTMSFAVGGNPPNNFLPYPHFAAAARHLADCSRTRDWAVSALRPTALRSWLRECMPPAPNTQRSVCSRRWDVCSPRTTTAREIRWRC